MIWERHSFTIAAVIIPSRYDSAGVTARLAGMSTTGIVRPFPPFFMAQGVGYPNPGRSKNHPDVGAFTRWTTSNKAAYNTGYHFIWCPKYRRKVLGGEVEARLREPLAEVGSKLGVTMESMEMMPDYVHLFVKSPPTLAPHYIVQQFKSISARRLRDEYPRLRSRLPTLWTRSYYCESVGHISEVTIRR
jgi:putative transposase